MMNGAGGIRTPVTRKGKTVFKTVALSRSATAPSYFIYSSANGPKLQENLGHGVSPPYRPTERKRYP
jgi:hypothetical protein